jgi:hypothetical protein
MLKPESAHRKDLTAGLGNMEHRHFATIATIIREMDRGLIACSEGATRKFVAELFAERLPATNPKFDRGRFLAACGVES